MRKRSSSDKYKLQNNSYIGVHLDRLTVPQQKDESITVYWTNILASITNLAVVSRDVNLTPLGNIGKLKTLPIHPMWTKGIFPSTATAYIRNSKK